MTKTRNIVTPYNVGMFCLGEDECITQGINFAAYERGVADAAEAFSMRTDGHLTAPDADAEISRLRDTQRVLVEALREARGFVSSDYIGSSGRDMSGGALARIDAALASVEQPYPTPAGDEEVTARERAAQDDAYVQGRRDAEQELSSVLPGTTYMDQPDGGAPTILEQLQRQAKDAARYHWLCNQEPGDAIFIVSGPVGTWGECGHSGFGGIKELIDRTVDAAMQEPKP